MQAYQKRGGVCAPAIPPTDDMRQQMTNTDMIREITSLSSGTVGKLIGSGNYEAIDNEVSLWVQFVVDHKDERWSSWVDCWDQYQSHRRLLT